MEYLPVYLLNGVFIGGIYALIALGVVVVYKATKVFNLAVGELVLLGGSIGVTFVSMDFMPVYLRLALAMLIGGVVGLVIYRVIIGGFFGKPFLTANIATCILGVFLSGAIIAGWTARPRPFEQFLPVGTIELGSGAVGMDLMWSFIAVMVLFGIFLWIFNSTKVGLGMRSVAEDTTVAQLKGVKARQIQTLAWFIAGITAVIGGIFLGYRYGINSTLSLLGLKAFPVVFLGGLESIPGVIVGGLVIGMAESLTGGYISSGWVDIVPFIILLVVMALRPEGIFGQRRVERI